VFLFGKKDKTKKNALGRIRELSAQRMGEKDIIKKLKAEGYSFQDIERGMLEAIRQGVIKDNNPNQPVSGGPPRGQQAYAQPPYEQQYQPPQEQPVNAGGYGQEYGDTFDMPNEFEQSSEDFGYGEEGLGEGEFAPEIMPPAGFEEGALQTVPQPSLPDLPETETSMEFSPQLAIEELIEGVVNEKWEKLENEFKKVNEDIDAIKQSMLDFEGKINEKIAKVEQPKMKKEIEALEQRIDDIDARIGGIEKAFKQLLPSLTKNIEELSSMVHEIKRSTGKSSSSSESEFSVTSSQIS